MKGGEHGTWTDQLSDYLAEELAEGPRVRLEEHLAGCASCREVLDELRAVIALAKAGEELEPPRDLWPEISAAMASGEHRNEPEESDVIALPTARKRPVGISWSPPRLVAAAAGLVLLTAGSTWWVASGLRGGIGQQGGRVDAPVAGFVATGGEVGMPDDLASDLGLLEDILDTARSTLDPTTVAVLERNLLTIETAIADSRQALATDPGNAFLIEHLERMYRRKLVYLQDAVRVAEWSS